MAQRKEFSWDYVSTIDSERQLGLVAQETPIESAVLLHDENGFYLCLRSWHHGMSLSVDVKLSLDALSSLQEQFR